MSAVDIEGVRHAYGGSVALGGVSLAVPEGSYTVLLGPSGSGKTTLLSLIGGFAALQQGAIRIDGADMAGVAPARRPTATVFQDYALFPHISVAENVGFGLRMAGRPGGARRAQVAKMLAMVGLGEAGRRRPHQLSGGQRQRVALARALAVAPKVLLLDEPLGALDLALRRQMQDELKRIQRQVGGTFIHVTHDQDEALAMADQLVVMSNGQIEDVGTPQDVYERPTTLFTAGFVGRSNILPGRVAEVTDGMAAIETALGTLRGRDTSGVLSAGAEAAMVLRPEHIVMQDGNAATLPPVEVLGLTFAGAHWDAEVVTGDGTRLLAQLAPGPRPEGALALAYRADAAVVLPAPAVLQ